MTGPTFYHTGRVRACATEDPRDDVETLSLTAAGRRQLAIEEEEWERMAAAIGRVMI